MRILTCDGGGIMGVFTTTILERLVEVHPGLLDEVDLFAGTSTGGIIAMGLADGLSPADLTALYRDHAKKIFDDSFWDDLLDMGNAVGAEYSNKGLRRELKKVFGDRVLGDLSTRVLVPAFDLKNEKPGKSPMWKPKFFHNYPGSDSDRREKIVDVALRTSAAPTYFPSHQGFIDGGVVANNPSMAAIGQALDGRAGGCALGDIKLLSIGTGVEQKFINGKKKDWGWGQWARPLVSLMISGTMGVADYQCKQLLGDRYRRIDRELDGPFNMDETRASRIEWLIEQANQVDRRELVRWLDQVWSG